MATPINFAHYTLKAVENILTATPKMGSFLFWKINLINLSNFIYDYLGGGPAVTVDLNGVIGNDAGRLKFGGKDFSKSSKNICIIEKNNANFLQAECLSKSGTYNISELKLDGSLQITIPNKVIYIFSILT